MNLLKLATTVLFSGVVLASPARAALVMDVTGNISSQYPFEIDSGEYTVDFRNAFGPDSHYWTVTPLPITVGSGASLGPASPWIVKNPLMEYTIKLTTPVPLANARGEAWVAFYEDWYITHGGTSWGYSGGDDNNWAMYYDCMYAPSCQPLPTNGNVTTFTFRAQDYATWGPGGDEYQIYYSWFNRAEIAGELPLSAIDGQYRIQVFASAIPEPEVWAYLMLGFAGLGIALRKRQRLTSLPCQPN